MSPSRKALLLKYLENDFESSLITAIHEGQDDKLNGDNLDIYVRTNDFRMTNQNKYYHCLHPIGLPFELQRVTSKQIYFLKKNFKENVRLNWTLSCSNLM